MINSTELSESQEKGVHSGRISKRTWRAGGKRKTAMHRLKSWKPAKPSENKKLIFGCEKV